MYTVATKPRAAGARRQWADGVTVGPVKLKLKASGPLIGWELVGPLARLTGGERVELAVAFWRRVRLGAGTVWATYADLFPARAGGVGATRTGVVYVRYCEWRFARIARAG